MPLGGEDEGRLRRVVELGQATCPDTYLYRRGGSTERFSLS
jgi:hypothetical protein